MKKKKKIWSLMSLLVVCTIWISGCDNSEELDPIYYTPECGVDDLNQAIDDANGSPNPAIIDLPPDCLLTLTAVNNSANINNVDLYSGLTKIKSEITINGNNSVIDIQNFSPDKFGHFLVSPNGKLALYDLTLQNGQRPMGGSVVVNRGDFFAARTTFSNNTAWGFAADVSSNGGAIYNYEGSVRVIDNCLFEHNYAAEGTYPSAGGAIYSIDGSLLVTSSNFFYNNSFQHGGAIYSEKTPADEGGGQVTINDSELDRNAADEDGGAIYLKEETSSVFISQSNLYGNTAAGVGGAIYSEASSLDIGYSYFQSNESQSFGGAIFSKKTPGGGPSILKFSHSRLSHNSAVGIGGGIYSENSDLSVDESEFDFNIAESCGAIRNGGSPSINISAGDLQSAIAVPSETIFSESTFYRNEATNGHGGAVCHLMGELTIQGGRITQNEATEFGGGLLLADKFEISGLGVYANRALFGGGAAVGHPYMDDPSAGMPYTSPTYMGFHTNISDTEFVNNSALEAGGGLWAHHGGSITINRSTLLLNTAASTGGGFHQEEGNLYIYNSTFSENTAAKGGGLYNVGLISTDPVLRIKHSTFAFNAADPPSVPGDLDYDYRSGGGGINIDGIVEIRNSLVTLNINKDCDLNQGLSYSRSGSSDSDDTCGFSLLEPNPMIDPNLGGNGSTRIHQLLPGSPMIDILTDCASMTEDQIGTPRPHPLGGNCDVGAHEFIMLSPPPAPVPPPAVQPTNTPTPESSSLNRCVLFEGLEISYFLLDIPPGTTNQTVAFIIPGGIPGLELMISGDQNPWLYTATLGRASEDCSFRGYAERLYCDLEISAAALGTVQELSLIVNGCSAKIFYHPQVSIFEPAPVCTADLEESACISAGGEFIHVTDTQDICNCPAP